MKATDGPYADARDMVKVHTMFRRELALLPGLVRGVAEGDKERSQLVADHIALLIHILEEHHHSEDEFLWPKILARGSSAVAPVVHLMEGHHNAISDLIGQIETELAAWRKSGAAERGPALANALDRMVPLVVEHMGLEEERAVPLIERYITAIEWVEMIQNGAARFSSNDAPLVLGMISYEGDLDVLPPEIDSAVRELAAQVFASHALRVHGTASPPKSR